MAHTYTSELVHCVFSTQNRMKIISKDLQPKLWPYLGGIARKNGFHALAVGGTADHVHVLLSLPASMPVSKAVQLLKGGSSKWIHDSTGHAFTWQEGYGAFTVGISQKADTIAYIAGQARHHARRSFEEEFIAFLKKHGIEYDPQYVYG